MSLVELPPIADSYPNGFDFDVKVQRDGGHCGRKLIVGGAEYHFEELGDPNGVRMRMCLKIVGFVDRHDGPAPGLSRHFFDDFGGGEEYLGAGSIECIGTCRVALAVPLTPVEFIREFFDVAGKLFSLLPLGIDLVLKGDLWPSYRATEGELDD